MMNTDRRTGFGSGLRAEWLAAWLAASLCALAACSHGIDQAKFSGVYRAAQDVRGATDVGVNLPRYQELVQAFASQVAQAKDLAKTEKEQRMVAEYEAALQQYGGVAAIWTDRPRVQDAWDQAGKRLAMANTMYTGQPQS